MSNRVQLNSSVRTAELEAQRWRVFPTVHRNGLMVGIDWTVVATLALLFVVGLGLRLSNLSAVGFAEDEVNKIDAVYAYEQGDITANSEHPMLMKSMMYVSMNAAKAINNGGQTVSPETALRLPNVIFGALTVIPLFLLTAAFFDRLTGLVAAGFWAFGVNAITYNRIGKEDTLLVFFMLFGFYFYLLAKQTSPRIVSVRRRNYIFSGISFGLMTASKYFPHYLGLNALYHQYFRYHKEEPGGPSGKTPAIFYILVVIAFLIANPAILLPEVWHYLDAYMGEKLLVHTGYLFGGKLYKNNMSGSPFWGTPIYFYLLFMAIKIPLALLAAFIAGFVVALRDRRHFGNAFVLFMFLFWIVPYSLAGAKWLRYTLSLMPFVYMMAALGVVALLRFLQARVGGESLRAVVAGSLIIIFLGLPALAAYRSGPHYALYTNALAADKAGYYFPHDEFYDDGLREAIQFVAETAPPNAIIAHETPAVARYYLNEFKRKDLNSIAMSTPEFDPSKLDGPAFIIMQRGRIYFQNREKLAYVESHFRKVHEVQLVGLTAAEIFVNQ